MWLKEREFKIRLGGNTYINVATLIAFRGEPLFTVRRQEESGQVGIDCEVYDASGRRLPPFAGTTYTSAMPNISRLHALMTG
jgi:hypothetical protein